MSPSRAPTHLRLREQRVRDGRSQTEIAQAIGVSQTAVSLFEKGRRGVLSRARVAAIAKVLGVELDKAELATASRRPSALLWACTNPWCPSVLPYCIEGSLRLVPRMIRARADALSCPWCGGQLCYRCECGALLVEGAFCTDSECGLPLVTPPELDLDGEALREWAEEERRERLDMRGDATPVGIVPGRAPSAATPNGESDKEDDTPP